MHLPNEIGDMISFLGISALGDLQMDVARADAKLIYLLFEETAQFRIEDVAAREIG